MRRHLRRSIIGRSRAAFFLLSAAALGGAILLAGGAISQAHTGSRAIPLEYAVTDSCNSVTGPALYSPGFVRGKLDRMQAVLDGTTSDCQNIFNGTESGDGSFTFKGTGKGDVKTQSFSGSFTIVWPASSGFDSSDGTATITDSDNVLTVYGTVTSGYGTGDALSMQYSDGSWLVGNGTSTYPWTAQPFVNTQPLTLSENISAPRG